MNLTTWILIVINAVIVLSSEKVEEFRLPRVLIPYHYKVKVLTHLEDDFAFSGKVWVDVEATEETNRIVLNSKNLVIQENETFVEEISGKAFEKDFRRHPAKRKSASQKIRRNTFTIASEPRQQGRRRTGGRAEDNTTEDAEMQPAELTAKVDPSTEAGIPSELVNAADVRVSETTEDDAGGKNEVRTDHTEETPNAEREMMAAAEEPEGSQVVSTNDPGADNAVTSNTEEINNGLSPNTTDYSTVNPVGLSSADGFAGQSVKEVMQSAESAVTEENEASVHTTPVTQPAPNNPAEVSDKTTPLPHGPSEPVEGSNSVAEEKPEKPQPQVDIKPGLHEYEDENDFVIIHLNSPLLAGRKYRIQLRFKGFLSDSMTGYYRISYKRKKNSRETRWVATTVFEPNEARSAFPCFDEPDLKATFDISLAHDKKLTALSNMPVKSISAVTGSPNYQWTNFERTPKMSTYLVAFFIGDFKHITTRLNKRNATVGQYTNTTYGFWARRSVLPKMKYASEIAPPMKNYLENLIGVPDVMPKYDFVALPSFISNALENWGLVSFAEKSILYNSELSSAFSRFEMTQTLGHELAHTWFGNLVTPKYWDQIWLSEGFSNYFEVCAADHVQPAWDVKTLSLVFAYLKVFAIDAMHSSHALVPQINSLSDINEIFDSISYQKGYFVVRMLRHMLGEEAFMQGVRNYLTKYKFSNAGEEDLWDIMTAAGHASGTLPQEYHLMKIMENWTRKPGYPVLDVFRDYENNTATISQRRFLRPKFDFELRRTIQVEEGSLDTKWWIPLTYTTGEELNFTNTLTKAWIKPTDERTVLTGMPSDKVFLLLNLEAAGLYRVNYDEKNWELLINVLLSDDFETLPVINRVQLIDDLLDFARAGEISYMKAFEVTSYLKKERSFLPWKAALSNFDFLSRMFRSTDTNKLFKTFVRSLVTERFNELGLEPKEVESISDAMNRRQIAKWACSTGHRQCVRKSVSLFKKWMREPKPDVRNPIPASVRSVVYCSAIINGDSKTWQFLWNRYLNNVELSDRSAIINGLGCTRNSKLLKKYLNWSLNETSGIRKQDTVTVFKAVARNDQGFGMVKSFLKSRILDIQNYLGHNPNFISHLLDTLTGQMNKESDLDELEELEAKQHDTMRSVPKTFKQAKERVVFNIEWLSQNFNEITLWLRRHRF